MTTVGERVLRRRKEMGLSQTELANLANLTQPTISSLEQGRSHSTSSVASLAKALNVSALWLETGLGDPNPQGYGDSSESTNAYAVTLLECKGSCGNGRAYGDIDYSPVYIGRSILRRHGVSPTSVMGLYADGDSMSPFITDGDILFFDMATTDFRDGGIYLIDTPDGLRVKRINRRADGRIILRSDNPDKARYPDEEYSRDQADHLDVKGRFAFRVG